ncbi:MAG: hypothetical protein QXI18_01655 [Nitrososphaerota archaeon]
MSITGRRYEPRDRELALWLRRVREEMEVEYSVYMRPIAPNRSVSIYIIRLGHDKCEVHQTTGPGVVINSYRRGNMGLACSAMLLSSIRLGKPTLIYAEQIPSLGCADLTAEWYSPLAIGPLLGRLMMPPELHGAKEVSLEDVEKEVKKYIKERGFLV